MSSLVEGVDRGFVPAFGREVVPRLFQPVLHAQDPTHDSRA